MNDYLDAKRVAIKLPASEINGQCDPAHHFRQLSQSLFRRTTPGHRRDTNHQVAGPLRRPPRLGNRQGKRTRRQRCLPSLAVGSSLVHVIVNNPPSGQDLSSRNPSDNSFYGFSFSGFPGFFLQFLKLFFQFSIELVAPCLTTRPPNVSSSRSIEMNKGLSLF